MPPLWLTRCCPKSCTARFRKQEECVRTPRKSNVQVEGQDDEVWVGELGWSKLLFLFFCFSWPAYFILSGMQHRWDICISIQTDWWCSEPKEGPSSPYVCHNLENTTSFTLRPWWRESQTHTHTHKHNPSSTPVCRGPPARRAQECVHRANTGMDLHPLRRASSSSLESWWNVNFFHVHRWKSRRGAWGQFTALPVKDALIEWK